MGGRQLEYTRVKLSITLAPELVRSIDRVRRQRPGESRSAVIEEWLRRGSRADADERLQAETIAYYESLTSAETREGAAVARASSRAARRLKLDDR